MKKKALEMALQGVPRFNDPKPHLEQYKTPADIAADILFFAYSSGDIKGKRVADLGCGTGIFAAGAAMLGAREVYGIDVDPGAIEMACEFAAENDLDIDYNVGDITEVNGQFHTVFQNPPFGAQNKHADRPFLEKAMEISSVIYTVHLSKTSDYIERALSKGFQVTHKKNYKFEIPHIFAFHSKEKKEFEITLFRAERM